MPSVHGTWVNREERSSRYSPTMTLQGRMYHFVSAMQFAPDRDPAFLSVYFYDTELQRQTNICAHNTNGINRKLVSDLARMLLQRNGYVHCFLTLREWASSTASAAQCKVVLHADRRPASEHMRRCNGPSCSEVAALIPRNEDGMVGSRDIVVSKRGILNRNWNENLEKENVIHRADGLMSYVLLFSTGQDG